MQNTLVLVADFINEIVDPKGAFGAHNAARIIEDKTMEKANEVIAWARKHNVLVAHVKVGFEANYQECPKHSPMFGKAPEYGVLKLGTWGTEFHEKMNVEPQDVIVTKHRVSALYGTNLEPVLRANKIERVIICGVSTTYVVEATARELHDRDYQVVIVADACNGATKESHEASLSALSRLAQITTAAEFTKEN
ncbi:MULTISPECIES: cysteine hydrolase family protein [Cysteiniphilum]|uniref:cysteine hydrolase family protein n=1 Tax=Cysteiniphilum TaxID=2056696 RepID=UPI0017871CB4|nr:MULTISPECIES: isochorismatase family cysteine hydrolase [Cysteiniphilum]